MKKYLTILFIAALSFSVFAQKDDKKQTKISTEAIASNAMALAESALKAHGGEKFKNMKNLSVIGSVDITVSAFNQAVPATFATIFSDNKYRLEINSAFLNFKQIHDGEKTFTSPERGVNLPPINQLGLPLLQRLGDEGYVVTDLDDKKKLGFRITSPDGYYSDFYLNKKDNLVKKYESKYLVNNAEATTIVEIDKYDDIDGIIIPSKYAQRFNFGQLTVYAEFKAKDILVNSEIKADVFAI